MQKYLGLRLFFQTAAAPNSTCPTTLSCSTASVWECTAHTLLLHSTGQKWAVISLSGLVTALTTSVFKPPAWNCYLCSYFSLGHSKETKKLDTQNYKTQDSCWNQTLDSLCVYTASLSVCLCDVLPVFPPCVRSHDLVTDTGLWSIVYLNKLHSLTTERPTETRPEQDNQSDHHRQR